MVALVRIITSVGSWRGYHYFCGVVAWVKLVVWMGVIFSTRHGRVLVGVTAVVAVLVTIDGVRWSGVGFIF